MRSLGVRAPLAAVLLVTGAGGAAVATAAGTPAPVAHGSARQVYATGLAPGASTELLSSAGREVATKPADSLGGVLYTGVAPGSGYRVRLLPAGPSSAPVTVHSEQPAPWDPSVYSQSIPDSGYGYLTTRDGTRLAIDVHPPTAPAGQPTPPVTLPSGLPDYAPPYPTLIEYSGYGYANPAGPENGIAILANLMGFAVVDVNMRGTGCSGGAYNFFEPLQSLDGYDVIETIARQPWVRGHRVGMMGISYGAISQLFTAATQPPSLAAIAPLSTIDATATTLYPGGVLNTGFAVAWAAERQQNAEPAGPGTGQGWAYSRIQAGDTTCAANQALHGEAQDLPATIAANSHYRPAFADPLDPITFVHKINVPVYLACQWQDEQTGGHCADLVSHFTGTRQAWFTFTNGAHIDSLDPATYTRWYDFLELFVAHQAPALNAAVVAAAAPVIYQQAMGLPTTDVVTLPPDPIQAQPTYAGALAAFSALPKVRVLFDNGAGAAPTGTTTAGNPYPGFEADFATLPVPGTTAARFYLAPDGALSASPAAAGADSYTSDAGALPLTDFTGSTGGGGLWGNASQWSWNWKPNPAGTSVSYVSAPLTATTTVVGGGAVYAWVRSSTPDVDLQATLSEVDPSGHETFVQNGWLRASERKLATGPHTLLAQPSTLLQPVPSELAADAAPMPAGQFVPVAIPLYFEGHAYRAGSRIRITLAAPNGTQPVWSFSSTEPATGTATVAIGYGSQLPSELVLPVVPGVSVPTAVPPCGSLRNEPCRTYAPTPNTPAS